MLFPHWAGEIRPRRALYGGIVVLALLASGSGIGCSAGSTVDPKENADDNGDGVLDTLGRALDLDSDGAWDWYDVDQDGTPDGVGVDINGDGEFEGVGIDTNGDGLIDGVDTTGNKMPDIVEVPEEGDSTIVVPEGDGDGDGDASDEEYCNDFATTFEPKTPTVYVLVDRSTSMFGNEDFWGTLKASVLPVIEQLSGDVRFGFGSYTGTSNECTGLSEGTPIAQDNYTAIEAAYNGLGHPGTKSETPTAQAITQATSLLLADESPGDRFILLVTDGDPDFCNDPAPQCGADALIASLQHAAAQGVRTLVFGIDNPQIQNPDWFDFYAQAGMGELPLWDEGLDVGEYTGTLQSQCTNQEQWSVYREANGNLPDPTMCGANQPPEGNSACYLPAGDYSETGGTASAFLEADPAALAQLILQSVEALKSCRFDFNFEVKDASTGEIFVGDLTTPIPRDQWEMVEASVLELKGEACVRWQDPSVVDFFAGFPCEAIEEIIR